ncbi:MAG: phosphatase, partial [Sulfuricurvum sp. 24-42-5]
NESFENVLSERLSRRDVMKMGAGLIGATMFGSFMSGCNDEDTSLASPVAAAALLQFKPVAKNLNDTITLPEGYSYKVLYATGDPIKTGVSAYKNDGSDTGDFDLRCGDNHDGMHYFGLNANSTAIDHNSSNNALLCINHEYIEQGYLHTDAENAVGFNNASRVKEQVDKEIAAHGVGIIHIKNSGKGFEIDKSSVYNRRITAVTPMQINGPARGSDYFKTAYSTTGTMTRGTINNCANGYTPWGTYLTCEENFNGYYAVGTRTGKELASTKRYGLGVTSSAERYGWDSVYPQFKATISGADATADYRNEPNTMGWCVEIDPLSPTSTPIKRTAMGRMAHEGAWPAAAVAGKPIVMYMGDDARHEYIYKYVSTENWNPADATGGLSAGTKYLDNGTLYVAKFNADGTGTWLKLDISEPLIKNYATYAFANAADVAVNSRIAADAVGATKMDRPEWGGVHPITGEVYMTLTNGRRGNAGQPALDAANPRHYKDRTTTGNVNGHIIRWKESEPSATTFTWDIYLFGAQSAVDAGGDDAHYQANVNVSGLTADNDFSSPDGLWFSEAVKGLMWIQTDDGAYTDVTNCMMLAAVPGSVNDGAATAITSLAVPTNGNADQTITTRVGAKPGTTKLKRFLVGPKRCEVTGITETPDGKTIFVNIQHPGEDGTTTVFNSNWPAGGTSRPRSATIVITKNDGKTVGL